ncbi:GNAT family N-acetyltransferase [Shewanella sp. TC10]|uniref:GNAT family N-acetyltransferase n=1 Tax=Shewanella sp. TC10 TaxID=1419739 RepID=UPI00129D4989|nr:GNAT family N-acetyltransferase [Shewanella sp. TC10]
MIEIVETQDLKSSAQFTFDNMKSYYEIYGVDWGTEDVYQATKGLSNFDILSNGQRIGVLRLSFERERCQLRDIQVGAAHQSKGYGAQVISRVKDIAQQRTLNAIELKVFQRSPAHKLYSRNGFTVDSKDERFYYMSLSVS